MGATSLGFVVALMAGVVLALDLSSDGGYLWQHWTLARGIERDVQRALRMLVALAVTPSTWAVAAPLVVVFASRSLRTAYRSRASMGREVVGVYAALAFGFSFLTSGFKGASVNYWLEFVFVASAAAAICWHELTRERRFPRAARWIQPDDARVSARRDGGIQQRTQLWRPAIGVLPMLVEVVGPPCGDDEVRVLRDATLVQISVGGRMSH